MLPLHIGGTAIGSPIYAVAALLVLWWVNARGIRAGVGAQNWLTALEVGGLLLIVAAGAVAGHRRRSRSGRGTRCGGCRARRPALAAFGLAMVFVLLTFGGWNEAAYISAELKDQRRNMVRALVLSIVLDHAALPARQLGLLARARACRAWPARRRWQPT